MVFLCLSIKRRHVEDQLVQSGDHLDQTTRNRDPPAPPRPVVEGHPDDARALVDVADRSGLTVNGYRAISTVDSASHESKAHPDFYVEVNHSVLYPFHSTKADTC